MLDMLPYIAGSGVLCAVVTYLVVNGQKREVEKEHNDLADLLVGEISKLHVNQELPSDDAPVTRLEFQELQRSCEKIHKDVLGWLKAIGAKEQRINRVVSTDEEEEPGMSEEEARALLASNGTGTAQPAPTNQPLTIQQIEALGG